MRRALTALLLAPAWAAAEVSVAAIPFLSIGVSDEDAWVLAAEIASHGAARISGRALTAQQARALLPPEALPDSCMEDPACVRIVAGRLQVDELVFVVATSVGGEGAVVRIAATRADSKTGRISVRAESSVPPEASPRAAALEGLAAVLFPSRPAVPALAAPPVSEPAATTAMSESEKRPMPKWWLWGIGGAATVAAISLVVMLATRGGGEDIPSGTLGQFGPGADVGLR